MENSEKNHLVTKTSQVRKHLIEHRHITSWEAINLYGATRLSAIIFNLRRRGMNIYSQSKLTKDRNGNNCNFVKYVLIQD
jgi:hypothetical protein